MAYVSWVSTDPDMNDDDFVRHPSDVCEPINLAATEAPKLRHQLMTNCKELSTMQKETIRRIMDSLDRRGAFLLGDATGVGKGRTLAGLILEYSACVAEARALWVSASSRLEAEARQELQITGADSESVRFFSYAALQNTHNTEKLQAWLTECQSPPLIILDECHLLRNAKCLGSQVVEGVLNYCTAANVVYSSATPCSQARHLGYLGRLGLFDTAESPFESYTRMRSELCAHGSAYMELLAMDMKSRGAYVARQLSFNSVEIQSQVHVLSDAERNTYDRCTDAIRESSTAGSQQQRFFQKLITALKVDTAIRVIDQEVAAGHSVVVSLINTGDAAAKRRDSSTRGMPLFDDNETALELLHDLDLPYNPLDKLVAHFGAENIAEITGRKKRPVMQDHDDRVVSAAVPPPAREVADFVHGRKHIAVISRAGGTGISLHDKHDGRRRVHVILELPWSAEELLQQMGRTHRSDSAQAPKYILITTNVPSELRFASSIVHKLQTFGALVKGDRTSCNFDFVRVPSWTIHDKRSISLCLAAAELIRDGDHLPLCNRRQALLACNVSSRGATEAATKTRVIKALQQHTQDDDNGSFDATRQTLLAAARRLYPYDVTMLFERWSPDAHAHFPHTFREQVFALLLCHGAWETGRTLGKLPKELLYVIVEHHARPFSVPVMRQLSAAVRESGIADISTAHMDHILNRLLCARLQLQEAFLCTAEMLSKPAPIKPSTNTLEQYASDRAGACIDARIQDVRYCNFDAGATGVCITVEYRTAQPPPPPPDARFYRHVHGSRSAWYSNSVAVFDDARVIRVEDEAVLRERDFFPSTRVQWEGALLHRQTVAGRRRKRQPTRFYLATREMLRNWSQSQKRVLRIPPCPQFPHGIIGLLMHIK